MNQPGIPANIQVGYAPVARLSDDLLDTLGHSGTSVGHGVLASALTLGRLIKIEEGMDKDEEIAFVQDIMEWCSAYFAEGMAS